MNDEIPNRALQLFEPDPAAVYTIEAAARLLHVPRHTILVYYKYGLVSPVIDPELGGYYFNDEGIRALQQIEHLRTDLGISLTGARIILDLMGQLERLRTEVRFLRG
jgi:DNA-binding transcriptional MerR regulator